MLKKINKNPAIEIPILWYQRQHISFAKLVELLGLSEEAIKTELQYRGIESQPTFIEPAELEEDIRNA